MPRIWNGNDLTLRIPELGMRVDSAALIPEFAAQMLDSGLFSDTGATLIAPLDDLKQWLRAQDGGGEGTQVQELWDLLLGQEFKDRAKAKKEGVSFDLVEYELTQMSSDASYEHFDAAWVRKILALVVSEADPLQAFSKLEFVQDFSLSVSFMLPDPRKHPLFKLAEIEESLKRFGGRDLRAERSGALLLELGPRGFSPERKAAAGTGFVKVALADPRAGDETDASLSLAYPLELEGYFLMTFDALRRRLTLKEGA